MIRLRSRSGRQRLIQGGCCVCVTAEAACCGCKRTPIPDELKHRLRVFGIHDGRCIMGVEDDLEKRLQVCGVG